MPCRNPCRLYIYLAFTYSVGPSRVVWSELGPAPPFPRARVREVWWSRALSLVCVKWPLYVPHITSPWGFALLDVWATCLEGMLGLWAKASEHCLKWAYLSSCNIKKNLNPYMFVDDWSQMTSTRTNPWTIQLKWCQLVFIFISKCWMNERYVCMRKIPLSLPTALLWTLVKLSTHHED